MYISLQLLHSVMYTTIFELHLMSLFIVNFVYGFFKSVGLHFYNYITYSTSFIIAFGNPCVVIYLNVEEVSIIFRF